LNAKDEVFGKLFRGVDSERLDIDHQMHWSFLFTQINKPFVVVVSFFAVMTKDDVALRIVSDVNLYRVKRIGRCYNTFNGVFLVYITSMSDVPHPSIVVSCYIPTD
jgi:hypothetical protein